MILSQFSARTAAQFSIRCSHCCSELGQSQIALDSCDRVDCVAELHKWLKDRYVDLDSQDKGEKNIRPDKCQVFYFDLIQSANFRWNPSFLEKLLTSIDYSSLIWVVELTAFLMAEKNPSLI